MLTVWYDKNKLNLTEHDMFELLNLDTEEKEFLLKNKMKFKLETYSRKGRYQFWSGNKIKHSEIKMIKQYYIRLYDSDEYRIFGVNIDRYEVAKDKLKEIMNSHENK